MEKGNPPCVERIDRVREMDLIIWHEGDGGARCVDRGLELEAWSFFTQCVDRSLELGVLKIAWRALCASSACERADGKCLK